MSWKGSVRFWTVGRFDYHVWVHALDKRQRRIHDVSVGLRSWRVWPPRSVLDPDTEFTLSTRDECLLEIRHCLDMLRTHYQDFKA